jgi:acyl carrier protein
MDTPFIAPRTSLERDISNIWGNILSLDQVGVHDNFFDLGGHSLAAFRIVSRVIQTFRVDLSPKALFDSPTVAEMAIVIETNMPKPATQEKLDRILSEVEALSNEEAKRLLTEVSKAKNNARARQ